jgi:hypothetical protein
VSGRALGPALTDLRRPSSCAAGDAGELDLVVSGVTHSECARSQTRASRHGRVCHEGKLPGRTGDHEGRHRVLGSSGTHRRSSPCGRQRTARQRRAGSACAAVQLDAQARRSAAGDRVECRVHAATRPGVGRSRAALAAPKRQACSGASEGVGRARPSPGASASWGAPLDVRHSSGRAKRAPARRSTCWTAASQAAAESSSAALCPDVPTDRIGRWSDGHAACLRRPGPVDRSQTLSRSCGAPSRSTSAPGRAWPVSAPSAAARTSNCSPVSVGAFDLSGEG